MAGIGRDIAIAAATAATATLVTALITHWLTKESTIKSVAEGKTPLPTGSTPTTKPMSDAQTENKGSTPTPSPVPPSIEKLANIAQQFAPENYMFGEGAKGYDQWDKFNQ